MLAGALPVSELRGGVDEAVVLTPLVRPRLLLDAKDYEGGEERKEGTSRVREKSWASGAPRDWAAARSCRALWPRARVRRAVAALSCGAHS